jgi:HK97 family phage major capsid protein
MPALTEEEFTEKVSDIVVRSVQPLLDKHGEALDTIKDEVDAKIKEIAGDVSALRPQIEVGDETVDKDPKGGFGCLSDFAAHVAKADKSNGRFISKQLGDWSAKAASSTSLVEGEDQYGGYLIPPEFRQDLMLAVNQMNEIMPRCTQVPMRSTMVKIPFVNGFDESGGLVYGGIQWKWLDELATKTETRPKFGRISLELKKMAGLAYASDEILEDSPMSMENILRNGFRDGLNFNLNKAFIRGTGAGQPLGILNAPCKVAVAKETGQVAATIVFENIVKMYARMFDVSNAVWLANQNCLPQLAAMSLSVGTGGVPVWLPANSVSGAPYDTLMGKPLIWSKHCSTLGTEGDIVFADWSQYLVGQKAGQGADGKYDTSIHLKFDADQTCFRFVFRIDGQPWWPSALTPPQATSDTISPFITLATRS